MCKGNEMKGDRILDYAKVQAVPYDWFQKSDLSKCLFIITHINKKPLTRKQTLEVRRVNLDEKSVSHHLIKDFPPLVGLTDIQLLSECEYVKDALGRVNVYTFKYQSIGIDFLDADKK